MSQQAIMPENLAGKRIDVALAAVFTMSRHQIQKTIADGRFSCGGELVTARHKAIASGAYELADAEILAAAPVPKLEILYEDDDLLAINKPANLAVHLSETGRPQPTVAAFAHAHGVNDADAERPGIVHRLDKDTSGVMVLAKHPESKAWLQRAFKQRTVDKSYTALVRGHLAADEALIQLPIGRDRKAPVKRAVVPGGRPAATAYKVTRVYKSASLLDIKLYTGRTHQIRVHLAHLGHPVIGDTLYGELKRPNALTRQFLHASHLGVTKPDGTRIAIDCPLPAELKSFLVTLENQV